MGLLLPQRSNVTPVPQTRAELEAMGARRGELQSQLRAAEERRLVLADQAGRIGGEARGRLTERLEVLDRRITEIESQLAPLDEAIANALARPELAQGIPSPSPGLFEPTTNAPPGYITNVPPRLMFEASDVAIVGGITLATLILAGVVAWRVAMRRLTSIVSGASPDANMSRLQQSVDSIAIEVERISENQRFVTRVLNEHIPALSAGTANPVRMRASEQETVR